MALALTAIAVSLMARPAPPVFLPAVDGQPRLWRGAYHVHSTVSDGSGSSDEVARAAADAGLDFVILTDHGDATRPPSPARYVHGVLLVDAVEISTDSGHYVALGLPASPYPLAGEGRAVAEDVARLGGIGILAHPDSPRPALAWHDPSVPADGFEWVNADTMWRGTSAAHLFARLFTYPIAPAGSLAGLASWPGTLFESRDTPRHGATLALAAVDAHARIGWTRSADPIEGGATLVRFPSYRAMFGTFGLLAPWEGAAPTGQARQDADALLGLLRKGLVYSGVFSMADRPWLAFAFVGGGGAAARGAATLSVRSNGPAGSVLRVRRNGQVWQEVAEANATFALAPDDTPAVYRAELWLPHRRGWPDLPVAVSQALAHNVDRRAGAQGQDASAVPPRPDEPVAFAGWHVEHDPRSAATLHPEPGGTLASATLSLAPGDRVSQFAALVADLGPRPDAATGIRLVLHADAPMRLSIQWREPRPGEGLRWRHSSYVDSDGQVATLRLAEFRPIPPATGPVPIDRVHALLLVMDTVNARPGDRRTIAVREAQWVTGQ